MYKRLRTLTILGIIAIVIAALIRGQLSASSASAADSSGVLETSTVDRGDIAILVSATGSIQAQQSVSLSFSAVGRIASVNVAEGDHVLKGQVLATLDNQSALDALYLAQARVNAQQAVLNRLTRRPRQVDVNVYKAMLNLAKARLASAQSGADKTQVQINALNVEIAKNQLWQTQLQRDITDKTRDDLEKNPRTAPQANSLPTDTKLNADIEASDFSVKVQLAQQAATLAQRGDPASMASAQAQITAAQVALDKLLNGGNPDDVAQAQARLQAAEAAVDQARAALALTRLVAPFDGVVAGLNINPGEQTPMGAAVVMLDTSRFYVDLPVDEVDISKVALAQPVKLTFDALPDVSLSGQVTRIAQAATKTGTTVTYTVRVEFDPAGQPLRSAMSGTATITTSQLTDVVRVRNHFVRLDRAAGKAYATVRQPDGRYQEVEIELGLRNDIYSEVKRGLAVGDIVAVLQGPDMFSISSTPSSRVSMP
jgi:HlyD family secretion protein